MPLQCKTWNIILGGLEYSEENAKLAVWLDIIQNQRRNSKCEKKNWKGRRQNWDYVILLKTHFCYPCRKWSMHLRGHLAHQANQNTDILVCPDNLPFGWVVKYLFGFKSTHPHSKSKLLDTSVHKRIETLSVTRVNEVTSDSKVMASGDKHVTFGPCSPCWPLGPRSPGPPWQTDVKY